MLYSGSLPTGCLNGDLPIEFDYAAGGERGGRPIGVCATCSVTIPAIVIVLAAGLLLRLFVAYVCLGKGCHLTCVCSSSGHRPWSTTGQAGSMPTPGSLTTPWLPVGPMDYRDGRKRPRGAHRVLAR